MIKSINLKNMFRNASMTNVLEDKAATAQNLRLLLGSDRYSLFGDPYYGTNLKRFLFEQSNRLIKDAIIDEILVSINTFMPQIFVERKFIDVSTDGIDVFAKIKAINKLDNTTDLYEICLTSSV
jgi:phage baseplate assembly protein W